MDPMGLGSKGQGHNARITENGFKHITHAGHTRKASQISKAAVDNCGKGWVTFIFHSKRFL